MLCFFRLFFVRIGFKETHIRQIDAKDSEKCEKCEVKEGFDKGGEEE